MMNRIKKVWVEETSEWLTLEVEDLNGNIHMIQVIADDYTNYQKGQLIQDAFPYLNNEDREIIISGMTNEMWEELNNEKWEEMKDEQEEDFDEDHGLSEVFNNMIED